MLGGPGHEVGGVLQEVVGSLSMINLPDPPLKITKGVFEVFGAVADGQEGMKEAQNQRDGWEKRLPGKLGRQPAIGVDRFGLVVRVQADLSSPLCKWVCPISA